MTEELQIFKNAQFGPIRVISVSGEPWFVASDVCASLDLSNPSMALDRLDADERSKFNLGRQGMVNVVNEYGLYNLVLGSRKPEARAFKRWVTHEVIPSIRRTGGYLAGQEDMTDSELMAKALLVAQRQIEDRQHRIEHLEQKVAMDAPKVLFADAVSASDSSILIRELAKFLKQNGVDMGEKRLFQWMRENGYLIRTGSDYNLPTQRSMELGLFEIKEHAIPHAEGFVTVSRTPKVTGKGQQYFLRRFLASVPA